MGHLSFEGSATGIVYGFLKEIEVLKEFHRCGNILFCWDVGQKIRKTICPTYQKNRHKDYTEEEEAFEIDFRFQMKRLRKEYLPLIGYKNIFWQNTYESDDIIASLCQNIDEGDEYIIISADHDLYQLLSGNVSMYSPSGNKRTTLQSFKQEYGIKPAEWPLVKALAGCSSDKVEGIKGVGEKTAIKFLTGQLKETTKAYKSLVDNKEKVLERNLPIVKLPFEGTWIFEIQKDELSEEGYNEVIDKLGMSSLRKEKKVPKNRRQQLF